MSGSKQRDGRRVRGGAISEDAGARGHVPHVVDLQRHLPARVAQPAPPQPPPRDATGALAGPQGARGGALAAADVAPWRKEQRCAGPVPDPHGRHQRAHR
eukprot:CAMPEP_0172190512 /NCGR_PEP_ID=MMETSP1050-20130122/23157_1 /TAXON_ID=233186 /ORGANISM="Cryptomonas curvata, Strain CCAP979/52" /LENGTH=99 /DNA_ID=CAMNT_0012865399 /DNA_START=538 /DNA_END=834 /DNA_ORIENTATION=+